MFKDYCENVSDESVPQLKFYEEIKNFEKTECREDRKKLAKEIYDNFIMKEMLSHTHVSNLKCQILILNTEILILIFRNIPKKLWRT